MASSIKTVRDNVGAIQYAVEVNGKGQVIRHLSDSEVQAMRDVEAKWSVSGVAKEAENIRCGRCKRKIQSFQSFKIEGKLTADGLAILSARVLCFECK